MATAEVIKRLSTRATAAEQMIQLLRRQIEEVKAAQGQNVGNDAAKEVQALRRENAQLKAQIEEWKGKLTSAEAANGIVQVKGAVAVTKAEGAELKPEAKKEKPKKEAAVKKAEPPSGDETVDVGR